MLGKPLQCGHYGQSCPKRKASRQSWTEVYQHLSIFLCMRIATQPKKLAPSISFISTQYFSTQHIRQNQVNFSQTPAPIIVWVICPVLILRSRHQPFISRNESASGASAPYQSGPNTYRPTIHQYVLTSLSVT